MNRDTVFSKIRQALGVPRGGDGDRVLAIAQRLESGKRHLIPERVNLAHEGLVALFKANMRQQSADVLDAGRIDDIPTVVAKFLAEHGISGRVRMGSEPLFRDLDWNGAQGLEASSGIAEPGDRIAMSAAVAGVAETGTLVLASGADNPTTLAFLPDTHVVAVREETIVGPFEDALDRVRSHYGRGEMPRSLNFISAPSRTGDIGGKIVLGAHGPRRLVVVVVKEAKAA